MQTQKENNEKISELVGKLWAHDPWTWGNTCSNLLNNEIDFTKPSIVETEGEEVTANVYTKDGRELQIGYQEGGFWMCFIKDCDDPRAKLTKGVE